MLASSALADDRTRVLKYGDTFAVFNRYGDIESVGHGQLGLFHLETRHLDRMTIRLNGRKPLLLSSTVREDNTFRSTPPMSISVPASAVQYSARHAARLSFKVPRRRHLLRTIAAHEPWTDDHRVVALVEFGSDYADIFEVRGTSRNSRGEYRASAVEFRLRQAVLPRA